MAAGILYRNTSGASSAPGGYGASARAKAAAGARAKAAAARTRAKAAAGARGPGRQPAARAGTSARTSVTASGDYGQTLQNEGIYQADSANLKAQDIADQARRDAAIKALQFRYNDPNNPFSEVAQLDRARGFSRGNMAADRTARGVLASGGTKLAEQNIGYDYSKQMYDAQNSMNEQIGSLDQNYADASRGRFDQQQQYLSDAQARLIAAGISPSAAAGMAAAGNSGNTPGSGRGNDAAARAAASSAARGGAPANTSMFFRQPGETTISGAPGSENYLYSSSLAQRTMADGNGLLPGNPKYGSKVPGGSASNPWGYSEAELAAQKAARLGNYSVTSLGKV